MTRIPCLLLAASLPVAAQSVTSDPIGFNKVTCLANSDTIVGVPLRKEGSLQAKLTADPVINGDFATLTLSATNLGTLNNHYLKFNSGTKDGSWYGITANSGDQVTVDLNGDSLPGVSAGDSVLIAQFWTLASLFDPALATTNPATTGHAIVASTSRFLSGRMTELLLPDILATGTNIAPNQTFFIFNSGWRKQGEAITSDYGDSVLEPDTYFVVRHPPAVTSPTTYRCAGEVEAGNMTIVLNANPSVHQDNFIAIPRAADSTLDSLSLAPFAFVPSTSRFLSGRQDELLVFNNATSAFNKAPDRTYFYFNGAWRKQGSDHTVDFGGDLIPAAGGFLIRKAPAQSSSYWTLPTGYSK